MWTCYYDVLQWIEALTQCFRTFIGSGPTSTSQTSRCPDHLNASNVSMSRPPQCLKHPDDPPTATPQIYRCPIHLNASNISMPRPPQIFKHLDARPTSTLQTYRCPAHQNCDVSGSIPCRQTTFIRRCLSITLVVDGKINTPLLMNIYSFSGLESVIKLLLTSMAVLALSFN